MGDFWVLVSKLLTTIADIGDIWVTGIQAVADSSSRFWRYLGTGMKALADSSRYRIYLGTGIQLLQTAADIGDIWVLVSKLLTTAVDVGDIWVPSP